MKESREKELLTSLEAKCNEAEYLQRELQTKDRKAGEQFQVNVRPRSTTSIQLLTRQSSERS